MRLKYRINYFSKYSIYKPIIKNLKYELLNDLEKIINNSNRILLLFELISIFLLISFSILLGLQIFVLFLGIQSYFIWNQLVINLLYFYCALTGLGFIVYFLSVFDTIYLQIKKILSSNEAKIITGILVYLVNNLSTIMSKKIIHFYVHADPDNFQQFIVFCNIFLDLLAILFILPILFLSFLLTTAIFSIILSGIFLSLVSLSFVLLMLPMIKKIVELIIREYWKKNKLLLGRLISRFSGLIVIVSLLFYISQTTIYKLSSFNTIDLFITGLIVDIEYHQNSLCKNIQVNQKVAYLKGNLVSIVTYYPENEQYQFTIEPCLIEP
ncbi:MAG: hypothetical protein AB4062_09060 [Crocosphaera sp.]